MSPPEGFVAEMVEEGCLSLKNPAAATVVISCAILVGLLVSYIPQHHRIISRRSSEGISPWFVLLGTTSASAGFANILLLDQSRRDVACCREIEAWECASALLGMAQLGVQCLCFWVIFVLFLVFFQDDGSSAMPVENAAAEVEARPKRQEAFLVTTVTLLHALVTIAVSVLMSLMAPRHLSTWATTCGILASSLAVVQYAPQIWTTYHLKHVGSLSIPMMLVQTPGGFVFALSLYLRLGWEGWSTWGIYIVTASMQAILLVMAIHYQWQSAVKAQSVADMPPPPSLPYLQPDGFDDDVPGTYSNHPDVYATSPEHLARILDRQEIDAQNERQPLLRSARPVDLRHGAPEPGWRH